MVLGKGEKNNFRMFQDWPTSVSKNIWMQLILLKRYFYLLYIAIVKNVY